MTTKQFQLAVIEILLDLILEIKHATDGDIQYIGLGSIYDKADALAEKVNYFDQDN